jgi:RimJ/RimL family protein N-acetyltransferase
MSSRWPFFDLRIRTPRLELRPDWDEGLAELAEEAALGVHEPGFMPFNHPWTAVEPDERALGVLQWNWRNRGAHTADQWSLNLLVSVDGRVVGTQGVMATNFAKLRVVETGSWIGLRHQGQGIGKEMRAAALHLAFACLDARLAISGAFDDNERSLGVSRALGYEENGEHWQLRGTEEVPGRIVDLRLTRERWEQHRPDHPITVENLDPCLPLLIAGEAAEPAATPSEDTNG